MTMSHCDVDRISLLRSALPLLLCSQTCFDVLASEMRQVAALGVERDDVPPYSLPSQPWYLPPPPPPP